MEKLKTFSIPVMWSMHGSVNIKAETIEAAIEIAKDEAGIIPLPVDRDYVDSSWTVTETDPQAVLELYNQGGF